MLLNAAQISSRHSVLFCKRGRPHLCTMTIDTTYQDSLPFLFAGNAGSISISALPNEAVPITLEVKLPVGIGGGVVVLYHTEFEMKTGSDGKLELSLDKILESIDHLLMTTTSQASKRNPWVTLLFGSDDKVSWEKMVLHGKLNDNLLADIYGYRSFITARPQISPARTDGQPDWLTFAASETVVFAIVYSDMLPPVQVTLADNFSGKLSKVDVSLDAVRSEADKAGLAGHRIVAYDIYMKNAVPAEDGNASDIIVSEVLRFIVPCRKMKTFEFVSSVGAMEPVYAKGRQKTESESEVASFTSDGVEKELTNDWRFVHETFTGYLASADEVRFWREFFASDERYAVVDGEALRIAVSDIDSQSTEGELNAFSFKWHFADRDSDPSRKTNRKELKQFRPKI